MIQRTICLAYCILISYSLFSFETYFHSTVAQDGDGVYSILRRYHLDKEKCDREQFLELNNLDLSDNLFSGKEYKLPILIYKYDGVSIRSTIGSDSWDQALRIKSYNEKILEDQLRKTVYTDSKILWVPYSEVDCNKPEVLDEIGLTKKNKQPTEKTTEDFFIADYLGENNKKVVVKDKSLTNNVYYVVSGHGGPDPGAMCNCSHTMCEDEYAYDVSLRLARELISHGATVHMIIQDNNDGIRDQPYLDCDKDEFCMGAKIPLNQKKRLYQRSNAINKLYKKYKKQRVNDQVAIMIHIDSNTKDKRQDVFFYHHNTSKSSKKLASSLQATFKKKYDQHQKNRGYKGFVRPRGLYMLNNTLPTAAYVELANIRNPNDHKRLIINDNREALAKWLYEGIIMYHN